MSFFKDFKDDLSQAVNELIDEEPGTELEKTEKEDPDMVVNTLEGELDVKSELAKLDGLLEQVSEAAIPEGEQVKEEPKPAAPAGPTAEEIMQYMKNKEVKVEEDTSMSTEENMTVNAMGAQEAAMKSVMPEEASDEVTVITAGTSLKGNLE